MVFVVVRRDVSSFLLKGPLPILAAESNRGGKGRYAILVSAGWNLAYHLAR